MKKIQYMVIEKFKGGDAVPVYKRLAEKGRMAPDGLVYISSWVDEMLDCCFQLMETDQPVLLGEWMANWDDIVEFEIFPVISSAEAQKKIAPQL